MYYDTGAYADVASVFRAQLGQSAPSFHPDNYGFYFLADQTLFREKGKDDPAQQGLVGFFRLTGAPADRNLAQFGVDGGLVYKGLIPTRDWDSIALGLSYLEMSDDFSKGQEVINRAAPGTYPERADYEAVIELSYKAQLTAWLTAHVTLERVIHPGGHTLPGNTNPKDAWAFILASTVRFYFRESRELSGRPEPHYSETLAGIFPVKPADAMRAVETSDIVVLSDERLKRSQFPFDQSIVANIYASKNDFFYFCYCYFFCSF